MNKTNKTNTVSKAAKSNEAIITLDDGFHSDLKSSVLVVSLLANLAVLIAYMVVQATSAYDHQVITFLLTR